MIFFRFFDHNRNIFYSLDVVLALPFLYSRIEFNFIALFFVSQTLSEIFLPFHSRARPSVPLPYHFSYMHFPLSGFAAFQLSELLRVVIRHFQSVKYCDVGAPLS